MIGLDGFFNDVTVRTENFSCGQTKSERSEEFDWLLKWRHRADRKFFVQTNISERSEEFDWFMKWRHRDGHTEFWATNISERSEESPVTKSHLRNCDWFKKMCFHSYGRINELFWNRSFCVLHLNGIFYRLKNLIAKQFKTPKTDHTDK